MDRTEGRGRPTAPEPEYNRFRSMRDERGPLGDAFARQVLSTTRRFRVKGDAEIDVLDLGCGYGDTSVGLANRCRSVIGVEPAETLFAVARAKLADSPNLDFRHQGVEELADVESYDLVVLDNVYEHLPDQAGALAAIVRALRPGGVLYLLTPNRLWPIEAHYHLPFLSYLPLSLANRYLRSTGRGNDYTDASYAPTYWSLRAALSEFPELRWSFELPGEKDLTVAGTPLHYRAGMAALERFPKLWALSKAFLVVAVKDQS